MIVKSLGRKERCFGKLARYLDRGAAPGTVIARNLRVDPADGPAVIAAFEANADYLKPRQNGNWCYHDIIALPAHAAASPDLTSMLTDLAHHYLDLRAPGQLAYGRVHIGGGQPHVHLMISANAVAGTRRVRLSRRAFQGARLQLETHKLACWPELSERLFGHERHGSYLSGAKEDAVVRRTGQFSRRQRLAVELAGMFAQTRWGEELIARLKGAGLKLYRRGQHWGVRDLASGRKHRFARLGLAEKWADVHDRINTLSRQVSRTDDRLAVELVNQQEGRGRERVRNPLDR